jgi:hypothetical protein
MHVMLACYGQEFELSGDRWTAAAENDLRYQQQYWRLLRIELNCASAQQHLGVQLHDA